ncbi:MAG: hypothetical protein WCG99_01575 [Candidatus Berkelbacteria bacterium]
MAIGATKLSGQLKSGQVPTTMYNKETGEARTVDTVAITAIVVYLAQLTDMDEKQVAEALTFLSSRRVPDECEGRALWCFNPFYPPDWEDTAFIIWLLVRAGLISVDSLSPTRDLLIANSESEKGTGVWVKDDYSPYNPGSYWDPTSSINILRLHFLLGGLGEATKRTVEYVARSLRSVEDFMTSTLFYTPSVSAFFAERLLTDHQTDVSSELADVITAFRQTVRQNCSGMTLLERALLGLPTEYDNNPPPSECLLFHHGRRQQIGYGSLAVLEVLSKLQ